MVRRRGQKTSRIAVLILVACLFCAAFALIAVFLLRGDSIVKVADRQPQVPTTVDVLVAAQAIEEGVELRPGLFRKESRPYAEFSPGSVVGAFEQLRGAYAKFFIPAGTPLLTDLLSSQQPVNSVVPKIRAGYRAITVKLDKQTTNEGWARAGVRVDVLLVTKNGTKASAAMIAQNVRVLSSGTSISSEFGGESKIIQDGESTVTLEVSAEDQKRLKLAAGTGDLRLLRRGDDDSGNLDDKLRVAVDGIITAPGEPAKDAPPDQGWVVIDGRKYRVVGASLIPG